MQAIVDWNEGIASDSSQNHQHVCYIRLITLCQQVCNRNTRCSWTMVNMFVCMCNRFRVSVSDTGSNDFPWSALFILEFLFFPTKWTPCQSSSIVPPGLTICPMFSTFLVLVVKKFELKYIPLTVCSSLI